ncbi:MAG: methyltransferase domain-containing protein [Clostridia bacterium]|nr:methyltransferase domain-containing protein [Clostridia bacterium]
MERKTAYAYLAKWFEYLNDDCGYEKWSQYLITILNGYSLQKGLDIGCGGGWFTRAFQRYGYQMTGLDVSAEMLDYAQERAFDQGVRSEYLLGDITKMKLPKRFDFATAINDCVNYIPKNKLGTAFKNVGGALKKGGIFLFDVSSVRKLKEKVANTVSVDDREEVTYLSFNQQEEDGVTMDVTLFVKDAQGGYTRLDERHRQYAYTEEEICAALEKNGFTLLQVEGHLGEDKTISDRLCFVARKE